MVPLIRSMIFLLILRPVTAWLSLQPCSVQVVVLLYRSQPVTFGDSDVVSLGVRVYG